MKHSIREIYEVCNNVNKDKILVTEQYVLAFGIPTPKYRERENHLVYARSLLSHINNNKPLAVRDVDGQVKYIYLFGEKTWFDTQEELNAHREEYQKERAETIAKSKIKKVIMEKLEEMSIEELETLMLSL